jgi:site-specific DNA recombinase
MLLEEMQNIGVQYVFWKQFAGRIERAVLGAVSEDAMELAKQRMKAGTRDKAVSGRVTAKVAALGYKFVDENGKVTPNARKWTYYAIDEETAPIIRYMYERYAYGEDATLIKIATELQERWPKDGAGWHPSMVSNMLKKRLYKGEFVSCRYTMQTVSKYDENGNFIGTVKKKTVQPESEWIIVPVPAIVDAQTWQIASDMLSKNEHMASRNGKREYLLTGLVRCAQCGRVYSGQLKANTKTLADGTRKRYVRTAYICSGRTALKHTREKLQCTQPIIAGHVLEDAVWNAISSILLDPQVILDYLDRQLTGELNQQVRDEIEFIEKRLQDIEAGERRLMKALLSGAYDDDENLVKEQRVALKSEAERLNAELLVLRPQLLTKEEVEERKRRIIELCASAIRNNQIKDAPFQTKRHIIKIVVDKITLNVREGWFRIDGEFPLARVALSQSAGEPIGSGLEALSTSSPRAARRRPAGDNRRVRAEFPADRPAPATRQSRRGSTPDRR